MRRTTEGQAPGLPADWPRSVGLPARALAALAASLPFLIVLVLVGPSIAWVNMDHSIWPWDPAWYGEVSIRLFATIDAGPRAWVHEMTTAFGTKAPGIAWLGQFFVPLGSDQRALLHSVLLCQAASLVLLYLAVRGLGGASRLPAIASVLLLGGAPLFVSMSHEYFVEPLQTVAVVWALLAMTHASRWRPSLTAAHLVGAVSLGLLAKISTPVYQVAPSLVAVVVAFRAGRGRSWPVPWRDWRLIVSWVLAAGLVLGAAGWYRLNVRAALDQARFSAGSELWGAREGFGGEFSGWLERLNDAAFLPYFGLFVILALAIGLSVVLLRRRSDTGPHSHALLCAAAALATVLVALVLSSLSTNNEVRYLLPLVSCLSLAVGVALQLLGSRALALGVSVALTAQLSLVNLETFGVRPLESLSYSRLVEPVQRSDFGAELTRIVRTTCTEQSAGRVNMVGVDYPFLNQNTLSLIAAEEFALDGRACFYTALGLAEQKTSVAWRRVKEFDPPYYISLDYGNPANRLPPEIAARVSPDDPFNAVDAAVYGRALTSGLFRPIPESRRLGVVVLRRISSR